MKGGFFLKSDDKAVAITKLQILLFLSLAVGFLTIVVSIQAVAVLELLLLALFAFVMFSDAKRLFGNDFKAVAIFFLFLLAVILIAFAIQFLPLSTISERFQYLIGLLVIVGVFFIIYRMVFTRNVSNATVLSSEGHETIVEAEYDFLAGINAGKYAIKTAKHCAAGHKVKIRVGQGFFGRKPVEIIE